MVDGFRFVVNHGVFTHDPEINLHQRHITRQTQKTAVMKQNALRTQTLCLGVHYGFGGTA